jgi:hypothetical protein
MGMKHAAPDLTICEVIRKINDQAQGGSNKDKAIREHCRVAELMAKKMASKLIEYKKAQGGEGWIQWELKNPTVEEDLKRRLKEDYK